MTNKEKLVKLLEHNDALSKNIVILCIGTDRSIKDSYGPMVGTELLNSKYIRKHCKVIGTLKRPVHALNLEKAIDKINKIENKFVIAIDAACNKSINSTKLNVKVSKNKVHPGSALNKNLPSVGDISIKGCMGKFVFGINDMRIYDILSLARKTKILIIKALQNVFCKALIKNNYNYVFPNWKEANYVINNVIDDIINVKICKYNSDLEISIVAVSNKVLSYIPVQKQKKFIKICSEFAYNLYVKLEPYLNKIKTKYLKQPISDISIDSIKTEVETIIKQIETIEDISLKQKLLNKLGTAI